MIHLVLHYLKIHYHNIALKIKNRVIDIKLERQFRISAQLPLASIPETNEKQNKRLVEEEKKVYF